MKGDWAVLGEHWFKPRGQRQGKEGGVHRWLIVLSSSAFLHCPKWRAVVLKSLLQRELFAFQLSLLPEDASCKPEGLVFNTRLLWRVSAWSKGRGAVAGLRGITPGREWGKEPVAAGEKARTKGCAWKGWHRAASGLGNFTKAMKCGVTLPYTLPAVISDVQYSLLTAFHFFVANN